MPTDLQMILGRPARASLRCFHAQDAHATLLKRLMEVSRALLLLGVFLLPSVSARAEERTLRFPADRSMGTLKYYDLENSSWRRVGEARGEVKVPVGKPLVLVLTKEAVKDLAPLRKLPADALDQLVFDGLKVSDAALGNLEKLTALRKISFRESEISDSAPAKLKNLKKLRELDFSLTTIGDEGVRHLRALPALETLDLSATNVTNAAVESLKEMKSLRYLDPQKTRIDESGLDQLKEALPECIIVER